MGHLVILSAPSGSGKSTIVNYLLTQNLNLQFSISATSRSPRGDEKHGYHYYFLTPDEFREKIKNDAFLEYEEVYADKFYGTLKSEVDRIIQSGGNVIFDVDVVGGINIKKYFGHKALSIFIEPPSINALRDRLVKRQTDSPETIDIRVARAEYELTFADKFDKIIINDNLELARAEALQLINEFLSK